MFSYILGNKLEAHEKVKVSLKYLYFKKYERFIRWNFYLMTFGHFLEKGREEWEASQNPKEDAQLAFHETEFYLDICKTAKGNEEWNS